MPHPSSNERPPSGSQTGSGTGWPVLLVLGLCLTAARPLAASREPGNEALRQPVDIAATHQPLGETLAALRQSAAVELTCEEPLAKHRITLLVKGQSLAEVMRQIARFVPTRPGTCTWERRRTGAGTAYRLVEDLASKQARRALQFRRYERVKAGLAEALAVADLNEDDLAHLRGRKPRLAYAMRNYRQLYQVVGGLGPERLDQVCRGGTLSLPFNQLGPEQQTAIRQLVKPIQFFTTQSTPEGEKVVDRFNGSEDYGRTRLVLRLKGKPLDPGVSAMIEYDEAGSGTGCPNLLDPPIPYEDQFPAGLQEALAEERKARKPRVSLGPRPPRDPSLLQLVTVQKAVTAPEGDFNAGRRRLGYPSDALKQIAEQTGLPVIADWDPGYQDYYGRLWFNKLEKDLVEVPLWEALDHIAEVWDLRWEKKDGWLRVRSPRAPYAALGEIDLSPPWTSIKRPATDKPAGEPRKDAAPPLSPER